MARLDRGSVDTLPSGTTRARYRHVERTYTRTFATELGAVTVATMRAERRQPCPAPPEDPTCFNARHITAWALHPGLREDPANYQPEHARCGKAAGTLDGTVTGGIGMTSRAW